METVSFGKVFRYKEIDYVYLIGTQDLIYAAQILEKEQTNILENRVTTLEKNGDRKRLLVQNRMYFYVKLTTEDVKDRAAHVGMAQGKDSSSFSIDFTGCSLNAADLKAIKEEIINGPVDKALKDGVKDIEIPEEKSSADE